MSATKKMLRLRDQGKEIVWSSSIIYPKTNTTGWPVEYAPRHRNDPQPWVPVGTGYRLSGGELTVKGREV